MRQTVDKVRHSTENYMATKGRARTSPESIALGQRMTTAMEHVGMSQADLARELNVNRQTIQQLAGGFTGDPGARRIFRIADVLRVNPRWLVLGEGPMDGTSDAPRDASDIELHALVQKLPKDRRSEVIGFARGLVGSMPARTPEAEALASFVDHLSPVEAKQLAAFVELVSRARGKS